MNLFLATLILALGALGHVVLWVGLVNRLHGVAWNRKLIDALTALCALMLFAVPLAVAGLFWSRRAMLPSSWSDASLVVAWLWVSANAIWAVAATLERLSRWRHGEGAHNLLANHTTEVDLARLVGAPLTAPGIPRLLGRIPYNQVVRPWFHEKEIELPRLATYAHGLRLVHLSDLHMSGRIERRYFEEVAHRVNAWQPDLIAITGDIVERAGCIDWIPQTIGRLVARHGVYFVLGNHDQRVDCDLLRARLVDAGLTDLGGRWIQVELGGRPLVLAGNELPWFPPAADMSDCPDRDTEGASARVLLAHSPDQLGWAEQYEFDLMLAGHCHGGQVRFPLVGAVLAPSLHGTRYAAGVFRRGQTVMHVSRGTSGLAPFRFNCPPEATLITLRGAR